MNIWAATNGLASHAQRLYFESECCDSECCDALTRSSLTPLRTHRITGLLVEQPHFAKCGDGPTGCGAHIDWQFRPAQHKRLGFGLSPKHRHEHAGERAMDSESRAGRQPSHQSDSGRQPHHGISADHRPAPCLHPGPNPRASAQSAGGRPCPQRPDRRRDLAAGALQCRCHFVKRTVTTAGVNTTKTYYFGASRVAMRENGVLSYLHSDQLSSVSASTDANGKVTGRQLFEPFGAVRAEYGNIDGSWGWATHRKSEATGLTFMRARWYAPGVGRFVLPDSIVPGPSEPQAFNRYSYSRNSPITRFDPSGHGDCNSHI